MDKRVVSTEEGQELAKNISAVFIETSAKNNINVEEAFYELVREIRRDRDRKGYALPKGAAPDAAMQNKIKSRFQKWAVVAKAKKFFSAKFGSKKKKQQKEQKEKEQKEKEQKEKEQKEKEQQQQQNKPASSPGGASGSNSSNSSNASAHNAYATSPTPSNQPAQNQQAHNNQPASQPANNQAQQNQNPEAERIRLEQQRLELEVRQRAIAEEQARAERQRAGGAGGTPEDSYGSFPKNIVDLEQPWFHGSITSLEADDLLLKNPRLGTFLIRFSSQPGHYAVSFIGDDGTVQKALIRHEPDNGYRFTEEGAPYFPTLSGLVLASDHVLKYPLPNPQYAQANVGDNFYGSLAEVQRRVLESN